MSVAVLNQVLTYIRITNWEEREAWWWVLSVDWHLEFAWLKGTRAGGFNCDVEREFGLRHAVLNALRQLLRFAGCTRVYPRYDAHLFLRDPGKITSYNRHSPPPLLTARGKRMASPSYPTVNTLRLRYQRSNCWWSLGKHRCFSWEPYGTHRYILWPESRVLSCVHVTRLCGLVVRVPGYGSRGPGSIAGTTRFFPRRRESGTGSTQPRFDNWGAISRK
jgi:hypothetical protein